MIYVLGGGANLNFKVVGGTSQPSAPAENTIWVNTSTSITSWVFSATQPTSPAAGKVWFQTDTSSNAAFNALKKNNITVYPIACKQYVSGAWVEKDAKIYQSGAWVSWTYYLFNISDQCISVTGGWEAYVNGVLYNDEGYVGLRSTGSSVVAAVGTKNPIDLTNFKTLKGFACKVYNGAKELIGVTKTKEAIFAAYISPVYSASGAFSEFSVDVSELSGEYYVTLSSSASGDRAYNRASQIWLE